MRSVRAALVALAVAASVLGGCTPVATHGGPGARNAWTIPGELRVGATDEPDALDPLFSHNAAADQIETLLFAYVFRYDAHGNLMPEVAREIPTHANGGISADDKTIVLHVRPNLHWSDGAPLDARDVRFTWQAVMNDRNNTKSRLGWDGILAMDVLDPLTIRLRLKAVDSTILGEIWGGGGGSSYPPLPAHLLAKLPDINRAPFNTAPISSGPFLLSAWNHGGSLEFRANPRYWRGPPKLARLIWKIVPNPDTLFAALQTHDIDLYDDVPESQIGRLGSLPGVRVVRRLVANYRHLEINTRRPRLADVRVRRAVALAIDWDRINATVYHGLDVRAATDIVPDSWAAPHGIPPVRIDLAQADRLLDAAGWRRAPGGLRRRGDIPLALTVAATNKPGNDQAELQMQQDLRAAGIELTIKNAPASVLFAQDGPLYTGRYDLSWSIDTNGPDPDNAGNWSASAMPPHGANTAFLDDPIVSRTAEAARHTFDRNLRKKFYQREEERLHTVVPAVFLYWEVAYAAYNRDLHGFVPAEYDMAGLWNSYALTI